MASNINIFSYKTKDSLRLKLAGNFDGSSAHELMNTLISHGTDFHQKFVDTSDLKTIHIFGSTVFHKELSGLKKTIQKPSLYWEK